MADAFRISLGEHAEVAIEYLPNDRISKARWSIDVGYVGNIKIWDKNISEVDPVYQNTYGAGEGTENIPGNYSVVEKYIDPDDPDMCTYIGLPDNLVYIVSLRSV
jgi:hypothetical protein